VNTTWFWVFQLMNDISSKPEIWILINSLWYQTIELSFRIKDMWKSWGDGRNCLNCWISYFSTIIRFSDSKAWSYLIKSHMLLKSAHIFIHMSHIICISKNKSLFYVKSYSYDIFNIFESYLWKAFNVLRFTSMEIFFIICDLDY